MLCVYADLGQEGQGLQCVNEGQEQDCVHANRGS